MSTCRASCADRLGRNPKLRGQSPLRRPARLSEPLPALRPLPGSRPVIGQSRSTGTGARFRPRRASLSFHRHHLNVLRPLRRRVPRGCASGTSALSIAFTVNSPARLSLNVQRHGGLRCTLRTAQLLPLKGFRRWSSALARFQARTPGPEPPSAPTTASPGFLRTRGVEEPVHGFCAGRQDRPQFAAVNHLGGPRARVPRYPRDLLHRYSRTGHQ